MITKIVAGMLSVTFAASAMLAAQKPDSRKTRLRDSSDWWSLTRRGDWDANTSPEDVEVSDQNFRIAGIPLGEGMFQALAAKFGKTSLIERGDGASGRVQACYAASREDGHTYLVFEEREVGFAFYLFENGPTWLGKDKCVSSKNVSKSLTTESGLRLGQTPEEVIGILGQPTRRFKEELRYFLVTKKKAGSEDLEQARRDHSELSEQEIQNQYGTFDLSVYISAKFQNSELVYLAVSKSETN